MTVYALGEALIDFVPNRAGPLGNDIAFLPAVGGAPLNVAAAVAKLTGQSAMLTQVGKDDFGDLIIRVARETGMNVNHILQTDSAKTALAFVTLQESGERSFSFYRNPSADMLYSADNLAALSPTDKDVLHFCSVSLAPPTMRQTHTVAIEKFHAAGAGVSFDINIRLPLWESADACLQAVHDFLPKADLIKISDDELPLVTGETDINKGIAKLFVGNVKHVIYTRGASGAAIYHQAGLLADAQAHKVDAVDATGAGDAFTGAMLYQLQTQSIALNSEWTTEQAQSLLRFACAVGALATLKRGAINSLPTLEEVKALIKYAF